MAVENARRQPSLGNVPMKYIALVTLTFQNSGLILVMHYSRIMPLVNGHRYYTSTAVLLNEVMKLLISLALALHEMASLPSAQRPSSIAGMLQELSRAVFSGDSWKLAIPAMLYTLQNSLQYVAVSNLDAATYQVLSQLKILTTAIFSVLLLGRTLTLRKWSALVVLMLGVGIVQLSSDGHQKARALAARDVADLDLLQFPRSIGDLKALGSFAAAHLVNRSLTFRQVAEKTQPQFNASVGLIAVSIGCMLSGLAGVYFEKVLKDPKSNSNPSVWVRNIQLSFYSLFPALFIGVIFKDGEHIAQTGFFTGYNWVVWLAITFQATGGVLVALVVKYADNIAKNFATSFSIIISFLASVYFFDLQITYYYLIGTVLVIAATSLYNTVPAQKPSTPAPISDNLSNAHKESEGYAVEMDSVAAAKEPLLSDSVTGEPSEKVSQDHRQAGQQSSDNSQSKREA